MTKHQMSVILARATSREIIEIAETVRKNHTVEMVKAPQKTLVMVKVRESIKQSLFYLGEVLASECMIAVDGVKGSSVMAGDDFEKVTAAAILDGLMNLPADTDLIRQEQDAVVRTLTRLKEQQEKDRARLNGQLLKSKVNFNVMGE